MSDKKKSIDRRGGGSASATAARVDDLFWKQVWKLSCPKKMIHFLWRLGHNSLALRINLKRRGMKLDTACVMCGRFDEDGEHLFFQVQMCSACMGRAAARGGAAGAGESTISKRDSGGNIEDET